MKKIYRPIEAVLEACLKKQSLFVLTFLLAGVTCNAQSGPAGVGSASNNIIWLDANELLLANGTPVSLMADLSGNGNSFTQALTTKQPVYTTSAVNGLPALKFDGVNDFLKSGAIVALQTNKITYFIVFQRALMTTQSLISSKYSDYTTEKWSTISGSANNSLYSRHFSPNSTTMKHVSYVDGGSFSFLSTHITSGTLSQYHQGVLTQNKLETYTLPGTHQYTTIGNLGYTHSQNHALNGYIAEVVVYNSTLSDLQRRLVENYLGAKYAMTIPTDLYDYQASHNLGLIALANDGSTSQSTAKGYGVVELSGASSLGANEYFIIANTASALTNFTTTDLPGAYSGYSRWTRTWKVDETGSTGTMNIRFYLGGGNNFANSSTYRLLVDNDGNFTDAVDYTGVYNASAQTITFSVDLADGDIFSLAGLINPLVIHSVSSGPWSNPLTWDCGCVPSENDVVFIDPTHNVSVDINASSKDLTVQATGTLTMNSSVELSIYGNWSILGTANLSSGTISMSGIFPQTVDASLGSVTFNDLKINNAGGSDVTFLQGTYTLSGTLTPVLGGMTLDGTAGNTFTFLSSSISGGARVAAVPSGFDFTGTYYAQRFIPGGVADLRNLSHPVVAAPLANWDDSIYISGTGFPDGCAIDNEGYCYFSAKTYKNSIYYNVTNINATLTPGLGYEIFVGDDMTTFGGTTLVSKGQIHDNGDIVYLPNTGWHLIGNPFLSPMLYSTTTKLSQVSKYFYIYDPTIGDYQWYDGATSTSSIPELANGLMATGQAAYIYVSSLSSLTFHETCKTTGGTFVKNSFEETKALTLTLAEDNSTYYSTIYFEELADATDNSDSLLDMRHLRVGIEKAPGFSIVSDIDPLRKNYIAADLRNKSFNLKIDILNDGFYTLSATNFETFSNYRKILLYDNQTGEFIDLKTEIEYTFYSDVYEGNRFTLILSNEEVQAESTIQSLTTNEEEMTAGGMTITQMGHTFNVVINETLIEDSQFRLVNVLGQNEVFTSNVDLIQGSNLVTVPSDLKGVHILIITNGDKVVTKKVVL